MAWTFTVTDEGDNSGATVAVTGSGSAYKVQRQTVAVDSVGSWTDVVSSTSSEATTTVGGTGYYRWRLIDTGTSALVAPTNVGVGYYYQPATQEGDSVYERCIVMLKERIEGLNLTMVGGAAVGVYDRQMGNAINIEFPAIILAIAGEAEELLGGSNRSDDYGYPVIIYIAERTAAKADERRARHLFWREQIHRRIDQQRWDLRVPEVWTCRVRTGPVIDIPKTEENQDYRTGSLAVTCVARQQRNTA